MKIAILGTRGIPNNYGGFEQFAEFLSTGLVEKGHEVTVYNSSAHPYKKKIFRGVKIKRIYDPEKNIGTVGQFVYDFFSILNTRSEHFDIILQLGYTSSSLFYKLHPKESIVVTNMDGLEHKRSKYSPNVQKFLRLAESLAVGQSNLLISDSLGIKEYLKKKYDVSSKYIPYGATLFENAKKDVLEKYSVFEHSYFLLIARLEPENSIEVILDGFILSGSGDTFLVVGSANTKFAKYLQKKFLDFQNIKFVGAIYDLEVLNNLRYFCKAYFHGHTVGGTNPSLLEAMASNAIICAHNNEFNRAVLEKDAFYFFTSTEVSDFICSNVFGDSLPFIQNNRDKILKYYTWSKIISSYEETFKELLNLKQQYFKV